MFDVWGFLLQTLTASGVAVFLLVIKALFRDKLPPKWHFAVWSVLGIILLIPAGWNSRYTLIHWQFIVELIKNTVGDFSISQVLFPIPVIASAPNTVIEWIFVIYVAGVSVHLTKYAMSYVRLRIALSKGTLATDAIIEQVRTIADQIGVKLCRVVAVQGLPSAFVCGIVRPILAVPADEKIDDKIILHELLHLKLRDTVWSVVICALRSLHWCNPLIVYCASCATNDMETRCDQLVLEQLEGEERREYGQLLLSMVNEQFAKTPGTTCVNNGGKHIRNRIETLARFKKYPVGMKLVSTCVLILLTISLVLGVQAFELCEPNHHVPSVEFASARSIPCTTYAGALDTYGKSILEYNGYYRVMCAPYSMHEELYHELSENAGEVYPEWDSEIPCWPNKQAGYYIYNLTQQKKSVYEALMVFKLNYPPNGQPEAEGKMYLAVQKVRAVKDKGRWVVIPLEAFQTIEVAEQDLEWGCKELPGIVYSGIAKEFRVDVKVQTVYKIESMTQTENTNLLFTDSSFDTTPIPNAEFTRGIETQSSWITHLGTAVERDAIQGVGLSSAPVYEGEKEPVKLHAVAYDSGGGNSMGESWGARRVEPGWGPTIEWSTGDGVTFNPEQEAVLPEYYVADLYVNGAVAARLKLYPQKEGGPNDRLSETL